MILPRLLRFADQPGRGRLLGHPHKWQQAVSSLFERVDLVIADVSRIGENLRWELEVLAANDAVPTLLIKQKGSPTHELPTGLPTPLEYDDANLAEFRGLIAAAIAAHRDQIRKRRPRLLTWQGLKRVMREHPLLSVIAVYAALAAGALGFNRYEQAQTRIMLDHLVSWNMWLQEEAEERERSFRQLERLRDLDDMEAAKQLWTDLGTAISASLRHRYSQMHGEEGWAEFCDTFALDLPGELVAESNFEAFWSLRLLASEYHMLNDISAFILSHRLRMRAHIRSYLNPPSILGQ